MHENLNIQIEEGDEDAPQPYCWGMRRLFGAVLTQTFRDVHHSSAIIRNPAVSWVMDDSEDEFSYIWYCQQLGFDYRKGRETL